MRKFLAFILTLQVMVLGLGTITPANAEVSVNPDWYYYRLWERTDWPIATGAVSRSWYWGPAPFAITSEGYSQAPNLTRKVQYWDKSRMEITYPDSNQDNKWYVTNGLLVRELVSGRLQGGDAADDGYYIGPANVPISGDPLDYNPFAPTYASFKNLVSLNQDKRADRQRGAITATVDKDGTVGFDSNLADRYPETAISYYEEKLGHNVPAPFWRFMNSSGAVAVNHRLVSQTVEDWNFAFGYPISDAYWTRSRVAGMEKDVLVQLFERRTLTYTPSNSAGYQVEMGNVGRHYYTWRYNTDTSNSSLVPTNAQPPIRLIIPKIGVNTQIEYVGVLSDGNMDTPANPQSVGWYKYGSRPGDAGNAVIGGHRDWYGVGPVVFWNLNKLQPGDIFYVETTLGKRMSFRVTEVTDYLTNNGPRDRIFGYTNSSNLNLITCVGTFDPSSASYSHRLVVYSTLVS